MRQSESFCHGSVKVLKGSGRSTVLANLSNFGEAQPTRFGGVYRQDDASDHPNISGYLSEDTRKRQFLPRLRRLRQGTPCHES
ncbi:MAG: hypothetical protein GY795_31680 [Desulfobacterales bacterium]|nr:hypothetical protein [Desulfobacterales bacterium]